MNEQKQFILFLLTRDVEYLPEGFPEIDIKKWLKKNDLQRLREIKRVTSAVITELKDKEPITSTYNKVARDFCPPSCIDPIASK